MKNNILILFFLALCSMASAQINYDEEHKEESFSLNTTLNSNRSYHYTASSRIDLNPGFSYAPARGKSALFEIDPMMVVPPTYGTGVSTASDPNLVVQAPAGMPYSLPMTTDVNNNGAAVITIPIDCPPGANGLKPDLSFVYNSQAGDGIMGPGWSIGGMSKISRVPYKYYYSNYSNAVNFTNQDDYSLDGIRLIKGNDDKYYPEVFDNSVITFANNSFTVSKPNGFIYTYGGTNDSKHYPHGITSNPVEWHISSIQDPYGNTINFSYSKDNDGGFYPSQISYSGYTIQFNYHSAERNDTQKKFFADNTQQTGYSKITKILDNLDFNKGNEGIHSYHLTYMPLGDLPNRELQFIQKYGTYNEVKSKPSYAENCTASCQFVWHNSIGTLQKENTPVDVSLTRKINDVSFYQKAVFPVRFTNGVSGVLSDMVVLLAQERYPYFKMIAFRNNSQNSAINSNYSYYFNYLDCGNINEFIEDKPNCDLFAPVDINGDGYNEILYIYHDSHYHARLISYNGTSAFTLSQDITTIPSQQLQGPPYEFYVGDFDGNGCSDVLITNGDFTRVCLSINGAFDTFIDRSNGQNLFLNSSDHRIYIGDFTGDGRDQLISMNEYNNNSNYSYHTKKLSIVKNNNNNALTMQIVQITPDPEYLQYLFVNSTKCVHFCQGDFNGDNKQDFLAIMNRSEDHNWYFYLSKGDGSFEKRTWLNATSFDEIAGNFVPLSADFNGDGFTDLNITRIISRDNYDNYYRYSFLIRVDDSIPKVIRKCILDGNGAEQIVSSVLVDPIGITRRNGVYACIGNFRGTSPCEVAYTSLFYTWIGNMQYLCMHLYNTGDFDDSPLKAIVQARNGLGATTQFDYVQHTYQGLYKMPTGRDRDPVINYTKCFTQHLNVVKKMKVETDEGVSREILYFFRRPIMHTRGKGFLGFQLTSNVVECQSNNSSSNLIGTDNHFKLNDNYYVLYPEKTVIHHNKSNFTNVYEYTYRFLDLSSSYSGMPHSVFMPVLEREDNTNSSNGTITITKFEQFDDYGNPQKVTQIVNTTNPATHIYTRLSLYTYHNIPGGVHRFIGLISNSIDKYTFNNNKVTINTNYTYDNYGFMTRKTCKGIDESFSRDGYGNTTQISRAANGQTRTEIMTYSNDGRFLDSHTDAMGNTTSYQYINRNGLLRSVTDPNGLVTTYHYDMLGNVTSIDYPDGTKELFVKRWTIPYPYSGYTEHPDMPATGQSVCYTWSKKNGQPEVTSFFDQHNRLLRTVTTDFTSRKIYRDYTYYNKSGLLHTESLPYFNNEGQAAGVTAYSYDFLDRTTSISKPGYVQYTHSYNGNTETIHDFDGSTKTVKYAPNGLPYQITDNGTTIEYSYYGDGKIMSTKVGGNNNTKIEYTYDTNRHPHTMSDPSLGMRTYSYNAFGELISETNNKGQTTNYSYDALGRMTSRTDEDGTTTWQYDQQMAGLLDCTVYEPTDSGEPSVRETFEYDQHGRLIHQNQLLSRENRPLEFTYEYNKYGQRKSITYPSGYALSYSYDQSGNMLSVKNSADGSVLWSASSTDKFGNITNFTLGSNINVGRTYDSQTGLVASLNANSGMLLVQSMQYQWNDNKGNLTSRTDNTTNHQENFTYDNYNRLTNIEIDGNNSRNIIYDNLGNVSIKYDAGTMVYHSSNPYAVRKIYDMPNVASYDGEQDVTYTSFDKVRSISQGTYTLDVSYGADRQRVRQTLSNGNNTKTKRYFTPLYEVVSENGATKKVHYLTSSTGLFAIFAVDSNNNGTMSYVIKDHQGSMYATVTGNTVERYSFDAWGRRRNPQTLSYDNVTTSFDRGYTLHEHYDEFGLINMNGRLYDPLIGRMLSPDIVIQDEQNSQAYNRYSYCFNNPLRYTDPSGYITTIPPEFEDYYYPDLIGNFKAYKDKLKERGADNVNYSTELSEGKETTTISWIVDGKNYEMRIVDHLLKDYKQICENSCVADAFAAQEKRLNGNKYLTPETIMSWKDNSCNEGYKTDKVIPSFLKESSIYINTRDYSDMSNGLDYYEERAYKEMNRNCGVFFNFYNKSIKGHVVNATTATQFILNDKTLAHEIRIWDSGLDNNGQVEGYKSLLFYDLNKLYGKFGVFHIKER